MKRTRGKCSIYTVYLSYKFRICTLFLFIMNTHVTMKHDIIPWKVYMYTVSVALSMH